MTTQSSFGFSILLVISIFINYIDRGNLSIAAPLLEKELSMTSSQLGALLSSFFWTYALVQLFGIAGWLTDRFPVGWVLAAGYFAWSAATAATGLVSSFAGLFVMRLVLGAGESVAYPCYSKILAGDFPQHHRGLANALIDAGSKIGPALGHIRRRHSDRAPRLALVFHRAGVGEPRVADSMADVHAAGPCGRGHRAASAVPD